MNNFNQAKYKEAIEFLREAWDAADNARSNLRDLRCEDCAESGRGGYRQTLRSIVGILEDMMEETKKGVCGDCDGPLIEHGPACDPAKLFPTEPIKRDGSQAPATDSFEQRESRKETRQYHLIDANPAYAQSLRRLNAATESSWPFASNHRYVRPEHRRVKAVIETE